MLPVNDKKSSDCVLLVANANLLCAATSDVFPKEEVADRETAIYRIEQVAHFGVRPNKRPLNVRQRDIPDLDVVKQATDVVIYLFEARL